jgi:hypothetical protein
MAFINEKNKKNKARVLWPSSYNCSIPVKKIGEDNAEHETTYIISK